MNEVNPTRREVMQLGVALGVSAVVPDVSGAELQETPFFLQDVADGKLPKVDDRIPQEPAVAVLASVGTHGGSLRMLMAGPKDTRMIVVYGYARLVGYTPSLDLVPDILRAFEVEDNRVFTLYLRKGHKWSDGHPFTTEDFRYWFEDVAQNPHLSLSGLPISMLPQGEGPRFRSWTRQRFAIVGRNQTPSSYRISLDRAPFTSIGHLIICDNSIRSSLRRRPWIFW